MTETDTTENITLATSLAGGKKEISTYQCNTGTYHNYRMILGKIRHSAWNCLLSCFHPLYFPFHCVDKEHEV